MSLLLPPSILEGKDSYRIYQEDICREKISTLLKQDYLAQYSSHWPQNATTCLQVVRVLLVQQCE